MTKRINSKFKCCKRVEGKHKNIWGTIKSSKFRSVKIVKQKLFNIKQNLNRLSAFGKYLNTKQLFKNFYANISEKTFHYLLKKSIVAHSQTLIKFLSLLESRLDIVIYRSNFVNSLYMARHLINHGFVYLNENQTSVKNLILKPKDLIELKSTETGFKYKLLSLLKQRCFKQNYNITLVKNNLDSSTVKHTIKILNKNNRNITHLLKKIYNINLKKLGQIGLVPQHIEYNIFLLKIIFLWDPGIKSIYYPIKMKYKTHDNSYSYSCNEILYKS